MKTIAIKILVLYQKLLSPDQGRISRALGFNRKTCIYYPTCSEYTKQAIQKYGFFKGVSLGSARILRCNPRNTPRVDELQ